MKSIQSDASDRKSAVRKFRFPGYVFLSLLLIAACFPAAGCGRENSAETAAQTEPVTTAAAAAETPETPPIDVRRSTGEYLCDVSDAESATVMVYMIGSEMESLYGVATEDLNDMCRASLGDNAHLVIQTGGTLDWKTEGISASRQRWEVKNGSMKLMEDCGVGSSTQMESVRDFIRWGAAAYPADRNILILWDHGGGTLGGFGKDETEGNSTMSIWELTEGIKAGGVDFDIIGFDSCLMGTLEVACGIDSCADYMIASEEIEPGEGWTYSGFLSLLGENPSVSSVELGEKIIEDFQKEYVAADRASLSMIDLSATETAAKLYTDYMSGLVQDIQQDNSRFNLLISALSQSQSFIGGTTDQFDLIDFLEKTDGNGKDGVIDAVKTAVVCQYDEIQGANGLAVYLPYFRLTAYDNVRTVIANIGSPAPIEAYDYIVNVCLASQQHHKTPTGIITHEKQDYSEYSWYHDLSGEFNFEALSDDSTNLQFTDSPEGKYITQPQEIWDSFITDINLELMIDNGSGYISLGRNEIYDLKGEKLYLPEPERWLALDGQVVPVAENPVEILNNGFAVYFDSIHALLNGTTEIMLYVEWEPMAKNGEEGDSRLAHLTGYQIYGDDNSTYSRMLLQLKEGDMLQFLAEYFPYSSSESEWIVFGDPVTVKGQDQISITYVSIKDYTRLAWYSLRNVYGDTFYTNTVVFEPEK